MKTPKIAFIIPKLQGYGGLEKYVLDLLLEVTRIFPVSLISAHPVSPKQVSNAFGAELPLDRIQFLIDPDCNPGARGRWQRLMEQARYARVTAPYDLLFTSTWLAPWKQSARKGCLICHFPGEGRVEPARNPFSSRYRYQVDLRSRIASWDSIVTSSHFGKSWLSRYWKREARVLYPSAQPKVAFSGGPRQPWILGCGFFSNPGQGDQYSYKRQEILIEAFRRLLKSASWPGLELHLAGHVSKDSAGSQIMERLQGLSQGLPVVYHSNCSSEELLQLYQQSTLFWHATGYGLDVEQVPFRMEHFGMVTVEAMSLGCVPLVYGQGGQREIVEDGLSGHWWFELDQLVQTTVELLNSPERIEQMSEQARMRAAFFGPDRFGSEVQQLLAHELDGTRWS